MLCEKSKNHHEKIRFLRFALKNEKTLEKLEFFYLCIKYVFYFYLILFTTIKGCFRYSLEMKDIDIDAHHLIFY